MELKYSTPTLLLVSLSLLSLSPSSSVLSIQEAPAHHQKLKSWAQWQRLARTFDSENRPLFNHPAELRPFWDLTSSQWRDAILQAASSLVGDDVTGRLEASGAGAMTSTQNVTSPLCMNHTMAAVLGIFAGERWATEMLDAMGKPLPGIMEGDVIWPGEYTRCLYVRANTTVTSHPDFAGRYCSVYSRPPSPDLLRNMSFAITVGLCVPDTCSSADITLLLQSVIDTLNVTSSFHPYAVCDEGDREIDTKAVVASIICIVLVTLMVVGTAVDLLLVQRPRWSAQRPPQEGWMEGEGDEGQGDIHADGNIQYDRSHNAVVNDPELETLLPEAEVKTDGVTPELGVVGKVVVSFSVYTNGSKLLSTSQPPGSVTCVHGVRFLSMSWVVLGHSFGTPLPIAMNLLPYLRQISTHWTYQVITNASVAVDSFFVLSGLLVAYLTLKEMKKRAGKLNWFLFYFHRFWRLTPAYMLCMMVSVCLAPYWGQGPFWPAKFADEDLCAKYWWTNLLYINNFMKTDYLCFGHTWYLANDMQFYILSPLIFVPLFFFPVVGVGVSGIFLLVTSVVPGVLSQHYNLPTGLLHGDPNNTLTEFFDVYYIKPYNRMGPYVIGMLAGYFLYRRDCKLRIHWMVNLCVWAVATASALAVLYGLYEASNGHPVTVPVAAFYNAVSRQVWGGCVAWVVVACVTGNGGFVNTILSWSALVPLSRLTYCIYLMHVVVLQFFAGNFRSTFYYNDVNLSCFFMAVLVTSCLVAFVISLAFEAPMMGLEKTFLKPAAPKQDKTP